jgi:hypothetical protein
LHGRLETCLDLYGGGARFVEGFQVEQTGRGIARVIINGRGIMAGRTGVVALAIIVVGQEEMRAAVRRIVFQYPLVTGLGLCGVACFVIKNTQQEQSQGVVGLDGQRSFERLAGFGFPARQVQGTGLTDPRDGIVRLRLQSLRKGGRGSLIVAFVDGLHGTDEIPAGAVFHGFQFFDQRVIHGGQALAALRQMFPGLRVAFHRVQSLCQG